MSTRNNSAVYALLAMSHPASATLNSGRFRRHLHCTVLRIRRAIRSRGIGADLRMSASPRSIGTIIHHPPSAYVSTRVFAGQLRGSCTALTASHGVLRTSSLITCIQYVPRLRPYPMYILSSFANCASIHYSSHYTAVVGQAMYTCY